jgi:hypothetical protein
MSLSTKIAAAAADLAASGPIAVEDGPHRLALDVRSAGPIGVEADALEFTVLDRPEWTVEALRAWGDRLASRVTYLMEPLVVVEADPVGVEVELRSGTPTARGERRGYYEVRLDRRGSLRLGRVAFDEADRRRRSTSFQLTREVLERLADDLVASVG